MVRAKFRVDNISVTEGDENAATIRMSPVYHNQDPNHENSKFWKWTPSGQLTMQCLNKQATAQFELGKEYYLDFTESD